MRILYIEPFHSGSHQGFGQTLMDGLDAEWTALTLPGRHWKWRMRGSAAYFALEHAQTLRQPYDLVLASSYLPLTELVGLCPELSKVPSLLYFHENQLAYPIQNAQIRERDTHFGFTQLVSALAARRCVFNSAFNQNSFLEKGRALLKRLPDAVPRGWIDKIAAKSMVLPVPLELPDVVHTHTEAHSALGPIILWNHRWEYDKNPEGFFAALKALSERDVPFRVVVCGQRFRKAPRVFQEAKVWLGERVLHWGYTEDRAGYEALLGQADIAVSTAIHEFFGVSMLEACHFGARPVVPDRLAYQELFPDSYRYQDDKALVDVLERLCRSYCNGERLRADRHTISAPYLAKMVLPRYRALFEATIAPFGA